MAFKFIDNIIALFDPKYKKETDYLNDILVEYKKKQSAYEEFRGTFHKVIEAFLKESRYKYQISSRTKSLERLEEKLLRKKEIGKYYNGIGDIEDLVGVRVIFYTERDKENFLKDFKDEISGLIKVENREKDNGYKATHIIMSFGPKRLKLSEYKHFRNLKCELQVTSIFHHAWAEIEHDLIYKDINNLKNRNPEKFELIKGKINQLLEKYIKKAAKELEEIISDNNN